MTKEPGRELTDAEWAQIESMRPKRPLTAEEVDDLRDKVLPWFKQMTSKLEITRKAKEARAKYYPIVFGGIGALAAIVGTAITVARWVKP